MITADEIAIDADLAFFEQHPYRSYRLRKLYDDKSFIIDNERDVVPDGAYVVKIVRYLGPDSLVRVAIVGDERMQFNAEAFASEFVAHAIWDLMSDGPLVDEQVVRLARRLEAEHRRLQ